MQVPRHFLVSESVIFLSSMKILSTYQNLSGYTHVYWVVELFKWIKIMRHTFLLYFVIKNLVSITNDFIHNSFYNSIFFFVHLNSDTYKFAYIFLIISTYFYKFLLNLVFNCSWSNHRYENIRSIWGIKFLDW